MTAATPSFDDEPRYLRELVEFLRIPSISREPSNADDMRRAAEWLAGRLRFAGGEVVETAGRPVVVGEWLGRPGRPTILVYGHYDVQPPGNAAEWGSPPFEPSVRDGRIYARGATDDKGPLLIPILVAEAFLAERGELPLNVRFLFEGEEEVGSPSLAGFLREHRDRLRADLVVSADGAMWRPSEPSLTVAARGLVGLDLVVTGAGADLHSGRHGGAVPNPVHALAAILASLHREDGSVAVAGFYDDVLPLSPEDREALSAIPFDEEAYRDEVGAQALAGEPGYTTLERIWTRPTLEVNGVRGGGDLTVIPQRGACARHLPARSGPAPGGGDRVARLPRRGPLPVAESRRRSFPSRRECPRMRSGQTIRGSPPRARRCGASTPGRAARGADGRHAAGRLDAGCGAPARHGFLLLLQRRREPARAERVLPARPAARGAGGVETPARAARYLVAGGAAFSRRRTS